jgi:hypothetical protein
MGTALSIIGVIAYAVLSWRLRTTGLIAQYRWLFWYSIFAALRIFQGQLFVWLKANKTNLYFVWWAATEVTAWVLFVLMVLELHAKIFKPYPGLSSFSRRLFQVGLAVSISLSLITLLPELGSHSKNQYIMAVVVLQRGVMTSLIVFLFVLLGAVLWFRLQLPRNAIVHTVVFFLYFLAKAGITFVFQVFDLQVHRETSMSIQAAAVLCVLAWIFGLRPSGEAVRRPPGGEGWSPERSAELQRQMGALGSMLDPSVRK